MIIQTQGKYEMVVVAADTSAPDLLTSTTDVTIYVTDLNDNKPQFVRPAMTSFYRDVNGDVSCDSTVFVPYTALTDTVITQVNKRGVLTSRLS